MERRVVKRSVIINAAAAVIWKTITDPDMIRKFLFGAEVKTDWKEGNPIRYSGVYKGKEYSDKGKILRVKKKKRLEYTHWSSLSGTADIPENYFTVIYELEERENDTILTITQVGCMSEDSYKHATGNWESVLQKIKELVEKEVITAQPVS